MSSTADDGGAESAGRDGASGVGGKLQTPSRLGGLARTRSGRRRTAGILVALIVLALLSASRSAYQWYLQEHGSRSAPGSANYMIMDLPAPLGSPAAALRIEACLGPAFASLVQTLAEIAATHPEQIRAEFHAYLSPAGEEFTRKHGQQLASVFVNGTNEFTLDVDGQARQVRFHGPVGQGYQLADLGRAILLVYGKIYGSVPEDLEAKVTELLLAPALQVSPPKCSAD